MIFGIKKSGVLRIQINQIRFSYDMFKKIVKTEIFKAQLKYNIDIKYFI